MKKRSGQLLKTELAKRVKRAEVYRFKKRENPAGAWLGERFHG